MRIVLFTLFLAFSTFLFGQGNMLTLTNGANEYVSLGSTGYRNYGGSAANPLTIEFWFLEDAANAELLGLSNGNLTFEIVSGNLEITAVNGGSSQTISEAVNGAFWHHVSFRFGAINASDNYMVLYFDNVRTDSVTISFDPDLNSGQWYLGALSTTTSVGCSASFDELRFWKGTRSVEDVLWATYDTLELGFEDTTGLVGYFNFQALNVNSLTDSSVASTAADVSTAGTASIVKTTAPCPYYTINGGDLKSDTSYAANQGAPTIPNDYVKLWLLYWHDAIEPGDDFEVGGLTIEFDTVASGTQTSQWSSSLRTRGNFTPATIPTVGEVTIRGSNHILDEALIVTRSIVIRSRPGNCPNCGKGQVTIQSDGRLVFQGKSITFNDAEFNIEGSMEVTSSDHTFKIQNSTVNIRQGGLFFSEASGTNDWQMNGSTLNVEYGGGISVTAAGASVISGNPTRTMTTEFDASQDGWRHFSSPNKAANADWTDYTDDLTLNFNGNSTDNVFYWDASEDASGVAKGWTAVSASSDTTWNRGYVVYEENTNFPMLSSNEVDFSGAFNGGQVNSTIYNYYAPGETQVEEHQGWNLIANPYPGALSVQKLINDYDGDGTQTDQNGTEFPLAYKAIHVWDARSSQYLAILADGTTSQFDNGLGFDSTTVTSTVFIRPFQSFWVKMSPADGTSNTFSLRNAHRFTERMTAGLHEYGKSNLPQLRMSVWAPDSSMDQAVMILDPQATNQWDVGREAFDIKSMDAAVPSLWMTTANGHQSIQSIQLNRGATQVFPVQVESGSVTGAFTFDYQRDAFDQWGDVWLVDSVAQINHHLADAPYVFSLMNEDDQRTLWIHASTSGINLPEFEARSLHVLDGGNYWEIGIGQMRNEGTFEVINSAGVVVQSAEVSNASTRIVKPSVPGVYFLRWNRLGKAPLVEKVIVL
ncbi:MAG: hypothetical protein HWD92_03725 [Flavobacteriia bacterium]|nr:hypothetical protein [Flavobacteriia bacterium]